MIVIADSGPLRYLVVIEQIHLLPLLYGSIIIPPSVMSELTQPATPQPVRSWIGDLPEWVTVRSPREGLPDLSPTLGLGEREALALIEELSADVLLVDDGAARLEAEKRNIPVQGTLSILDFAAEHGFLSDLPGAIEKLRGTNFRASRRLFDFFLERDAQRRKR